MSRTSTPRDEPIGNGLRFGEPVAPSYTPPADFAVNRGGPLVHGDPNENIGLAPVFARCLDGIPEVPSSPPWDDWLTVAFRSHPMPGHDRSGDAWLLHWHDLTLTATVVDGLGHGDQASDAAAIAIRVIEGALGRDGATPLDELMVACHRAMTSSRGAAIALLRLDLTRRLEAFCGVGNIAFSAAPARPNRGVSFAGTVGHSMRTARVFESPSVAGDLLVLHTDGIRSSFRIRDTPSLDDLVASAVNDFRRADDDQAIVAIRVDALPPSAG